MLRRRYIQFSHRGMHLTRFFRQAKGEITRVVTTYHDMLNDSLCDKKIETEMSEFCSIFKNEADEAGKCYKEAGAPVWQIHSFTNSYGVRRPLSVLSGIVSR